MGRLARYTSHRRLVLFGTGVVLMLLGLIPWYAAPYRSGLHFWGAWGCYAAGFVLLWIGVFLGKIDGAHRRSVPAIPTS